MDTRKKFCFESKKSKQIIDYHQINWTGRLSILPGTRSSTLVLLCNSNELDTLLDVSTWDHGVLDVGENLVVLRVWDRASHQRSGTPAAEVEAAGFLVERLVGKAADV